MQHVVYVHGLWMPGEESLLLRHRLAQDFSLTLHSLRYSAVLSGLDVITARLDELVRGLAAPEVHFVGHSLGGWFFSACHRWEAGPRSARRALRRWPTSWDSRSSTSCCSQASGAGRIH